MKPIELDREIDGRWIAEVPELNVILYGGSRQDAIQRVQSAAQEIILDRIAHGELPPRFGERRVRCCRMSTWPSSKARRVFSALERIG